jgi:hypothetical protein
MKQTTTKTQTGWKKWLRNSLWSLLLVPLVIAVWGGYANYVADNGIPLKEDGSWSSEVLADVHEGIVSASPIELANACGLGASSCFKCHNGKRADKPADKAWHEQHAKVNHSCVGCHKGNERLMLKDMAHSKLLADPRTDPEQGCAKCHSGDEMTNMLSQYKNVQ